MTGSPLVVYRKTYSDPAALAAEDALHHLATTTDAPVLEPLRQQLSRSSPGRPTGRGRSSSSGSSRSSVPPAGFRSVGPLNPVDVPTRPGPEALRPDGPTLEEMYNVTIDAASGGTLPDRPMREACTVHGGAPRLSARGKDGALAMSGVLAGAGNDPTPWTVVVL